MYAHDIRMLGIGTHAAENLAAVAEVLLEQLK
jgi:hypothetical protein